jgi:hypothetical protein
MTKTSGLMKRQHLANKGQRPFFLTRCSFFFKYGMVFKENDCGDKKKRLQRLSLSSVHNRWNHCVTVGLAGHFCLCPNRADRWRMTIIVKRHDLTL